MSTKTQMGKFDMLDEFEAYDYKDNDGVRVIAMEDVKKVIEEIYSNIYTGNLMIVSPKKHQTMKL